MPTEELEYEYCDEDIVDEEEGLDEILWIYELVDLLPPEEREEIPVSECSYPDLSNPECYEAIPF